MITLLGTDPNLTPKEWNKALDDYLTKKTLSVDEWERMTEREQWCINEIKKSYKRTNK